MQSAAARLLPGIRFVDEPRARAGALPRMDVAALTGFAARGPLHVPVAVEDPLQFRELFGDDLALAWDAAGRRTQKSLLGRSVELFFRNGGRRCWVVRVARGQGEGAALTQSFTVPGLYRVDAAFAPAKVRARSPGAWADGLKVGGSLRRTALRAGAFAKATAGYTLLLGAGPQEPLAGDLIELSAPAAGLRLFLFVERVERHADGLRLSAAEGFWFAVDAGSPPSPPETNALTPLDETSALARWAAVGSAVQWQARLLRMDLLVWNGEQLEAQFPDLGFEPRHPRYWGRLPDDEQLFRRRLELHQGGLGLDLPSLWSEALAPRFPVAGSDQGRCLPLGLPVFRNASAAAGCDTPFGAGRLVAEGLGVMNADLFLDRDLASQGVGALPGEAKFQRFVRNRPLVGIHSLFPVEEVSLIAVPDAMHRPWDRRAPVTGAPLAAPLLQPVGARDDRGRRTIAWTGVAGARRYRVEQADTADFSTAVSFALEADAALDLLDPAHVPLPPTELRVTLKEDCPRVVWFRVRAFGSGTASAWSNTQVLQLPEGGFHRCGAANAEDLLLWLELGAGPAAGSHRLTWRGSAPAGIDPGVTGFELQHGDEPGFAAAARPVQTTAPGVDLPPQQDRPAWYRVRALTATEAGPWSNTVVVDPTELSGETLIAPEEYDGGDLLAVHCALVRLCAARADTLALLALPAHYRGAAANGHRLALTPAGAAHYGTGLCKVRSLDPDERDALDHAALFHPWVRHGEEESAGMIPPDGAVLGAFAARSWQRGAWISPANRPLVDVLGLAPGLPDGERNALMAGPVNLLLAAPNGFILGKTDSLAGERRPRAATVRRCLHLLRRLIEREGIRYVFEPDSAATRHALLAQWQELLSDLYLRGALKGDRPEDAFRITIDAEPAAGDSGQLIVDLRVAPAEPLEFIRVRLLQAGPEELLVEES